jgi:hypothetical protein
MFKWLNIFKIGQRIHRRKYAEEEDPKRKGEERRKNSNPAEIIIPI